MKFAKLLDGQVGSAFDGIKQAPSQMSLWQIASAAPIAPCKQVHEAWRQHYLDYRALKRALWEAQNDNVPISVSPRTASLSVARHMAGGEGRDGTTAGEEHFMVKLQMEMAKVRRAWTDSFTQFRHALSV